jgi:predicted RNase H-like HicB family nuclease
MAVAHGDQVEHLTILFEDAEDGWVAARIKEVPEAISQGRSHEEARANVIDAFHDLLDARRGPHDPPRDAVRTYLADAAKLFEDLRRRIDELVRGRGRNLVP